MQCHGEGEALSLSTPNGHIKWRGGGGEIPFRRTAEGEEGGLGGETALCMESERGVAAAARKALFRAECKVKYTRAISPSTEIESAETAWGG